MGKIDNDPQEMFHAGYAQGVKDAMTRVESEFYKIMDVMGSTSCPKFDPCPRTDKNCVDCWMEFAKNKIAEMENNKES
jgi:hypothetical protein